MSVLRLQVSESHELWFGTDQIVATPSSLSVEDLVAERRSDLSEIQLFGSIRNAQLIEILYNIRQRGGLPADTPIRLGSPAGCPETESCVKALEALWKRDVIEGPGFRWVSLSQSEFSAYALIAAMIRSNWKPNDTSRTILKYHPAWPALSFLPALNIDAACRWVSVLVDPRWFVQDFRPNRINKLCSFLGLTPRNMSVLDGSKVEPTQHLERCSLTLKAWVGSSSAADESVPAGFLNRTFRNGDSWSAGMLAASKRFVRFVREVWLSELSQRKMFDPSMFFKTDAESNAYIAHCATVRKRTARDTCN